ncbi:histidine kinase [Chitinophagaceae bacterium LB-8]|uniref:Histidine kinase n=1 Tax=Paraflavisolibacter caeni TaxID=2982496 RepID=A0A9X2XTZ3_9BACT|nr:histidine kinase [Paraflavisolibacter caeni]MCU7548327.1 histidine kinase [Paraflavisolibacter caeni]
MRSKTPTIKRKASDLFYHVFGFKKISSRLQFIWVVFIHIIGWLTFLCLPLLFYPLRFSSPWFIYKQVLDKLFVIGFFYFNHYYLIPRFFISKKHLAYFVLLITCILFLLAQHLIVEHYIYDNYFRNGMFEGGSNRRRMLFEKIGEMRWQPEVMIAGVPAGIFFMLLRNVLSFTFMLTFFSGFIHLFFSFIKTSDEKKALENATLKAEINQLKSQINPHFLFNTLNSIYSLAHHSSEKTQQAVLKLSEIMRYMIYDATAEKIPLKKDIHYLDSYIQLQRLRLSDKVMINYEVKGDLQGLTIAPMLLSTFVENVFKHGISYTNASSIHITIEVFDKNLTLFVSNPVLQGQKSETGGVGLQNAKRRLELMYAGNYWLDIEQDKQLFAVNLKINLSRDELSRY